MRGPIIAGLLALLAIVASACGEPGPTPTPPPDAAPAPAATATPRPTSTPEPTAKPTAVPAATPTATPSPTPTPEPTATPTATPTPTPLPDVDALLNSISAALEEVETLHMEGTLVVKLSEDTDSELISTRFEGDIEPDGDLQLLLTITLDTEIFKGTLSLETREVKGLSYSQDPVTKEWEIDEEETSGGDPVNADVINLLDRGQLTVELDSLDGVPVYRIAGTVRHDPESKLVVIWAGVDDLLIRQLKREGHIPPDNLEGLVPPDVQELFQSGIFQLSRFNEPVSIVTPEVTPVPTPAPPPTASPRGIDSPVGPMALYESADYPFSIQHPADWEAQPVEALPGLAAAFASSQGAHMSITEEDLLARGFGAATLEDYRDFAVTGMLSQVESSELLSSETITTAQGLQAEVLVFGLQGGRTRISQLLYVQEGVGFIATYLAPTALHQELEALIDYSFGTFETRGVESAAEGVFEMPQYDAPPPMVIDVNKRYTATIEMEKGGQIVIELFAKEAPATVNNFVFLARDGYYDGVTFHRVIPRFMAQTGDPGGTGTGGPGYRFQDEFHPDLRHDGPGVMSMANSGANTNGSQFFITYIATPNLDGINPDGSPKDCASIQVSCHAVFGKVIEGLEVVEGITPRDPSTALAQGDVITTIAIREAE